MSQFEVLQNLSETCKMARVSFEDATAELDNVAEDNIQEHVVQAI